MKSQLLDLRLKKKKIAFLINSFGLGGAENVVSQILNQTKKQDEFEFELILLENEIFYPLPKGIKVTTLSSLTWEDSAIKRTLYIPLLSYRLKKYIKKSNIDFVLSFIYRSDFVNVIASQFSNYKFALSNRVSASSTYADSSLSSKINNFLIKTLYPKAPLIINVSDGVQNDLALNYDISRSRQRVIYNPFDIKKIERLANENIDINTKRDKTIVVASRLDPIKNIPMILYAFSKIKEKMKLIIIGNGQDEGELKELAKRLNINQKVHFAGLQTNPYKYMKNASIYISSSNSEGFPNALVEAMICKCSVISTDCKSGPREILAPSTDFSCELKKGMEIAKNGILVATNDEKALKQAIEFLQQNPKRKELIAQSGYERAKDFNLESVTKTYIETINRELA